MSEVRVQRVLEGKRVLVTRTREQASVLSQRLELLGALPLEFPTIRIVPPEDWSALDAVLNRLYATDISGYDWLVLTSANGVRICMQRLQELGHNPSSLSVRLAAIGPATASALQEYGLLADLVPDEYIAEGVAQALLADIQRRQLPIAEQRILLARAAEARKVLYTDLQAGGAIVDEVPAYTTASVAGDDKLGHEVLRLIDLGDLDIVTFTSSSTVRNFVAWLKSCTQENGESAGHYLARHTCVACIGPITAQTARDFGLQVDIEAQVFTIDGLIDAIVAYEGEKRHGSDNNNAER